MRVVYQQIMLKHQKYKGTNIVSPPDLMNIIHVARIAVSMH